MSLFSKKKKSVGNIAEWSDKDTLKVTLGEDLEAGDCLTIICDFGGFLHVYPDKAINIKVEEET